MADQNALSKLTTDATQLAALAKTGFSSVFQIAAMPESKFVQLLAPALGSEAQAQALFRSAVTRADHVAHQGLSQHALFEDTYRQIPTARTILSPAAYLVDLVRFIEDYTDDAQVTPTKTLFFRRPDVNTLMLDRENTETILPKLNIVNEILEGHLAWSLPTDGVFDQLRPFARASLDSYLLFHYGYREILGNTANYIGLGKQQATLNEGGTRGYAANRAGLPAAFKFDGKTYLSLAGLATTANFTFFAWVWLNGDSTGSLFSNASPQAQTKLEILQVEAVTAVRFIYENGNMDPHPTVPTEQWVHIALTMDANGHTVYVNGRKVLHMSYPQPMGNAWRIGEKFVGIMDSVGIYHEALSAEEIAAFATMQPTDQVYPHLAGQTYAFKPPFHLPLTTMRAALALLKTDLAAIYRAFDVSDSPIPPRVSSEILGLSSQALAVCTTPMTTKEALWVAYGLRGSFDETFTTENAGTENESLTASLDVFLQLSGLSSKELSELLYGYLSDQEIKDSLQRSFFIHADGSTLAPIQMDVEANHLSNLSISRLDRIYRFTMLAKHLGWSCPELGWVLTTANPTHISIDETSITLIAQLVEWQKRFQLPIANLCSLIGLLDNRVDAGAGRVSLQQVFQRRNLQSDISLPNEGLNWTLVPSDPQQQQIHQILGAALGLSEIELSHVAKLVSSTFTGSEQGSFPLQSAQLSALYRFSRLSDLLDMPLTDVMSLIALMGDEQRNVLTGAPSIKIANSINRLVEYQKWLQFAHIPLDMLRYILVSDLSESSPRLDSARIVNFLNDLTSSSTHALASGESQNKVLEAHLVALMDVSPQMMTHLIRWANKSRNISDADWLETAFAGVGQRPLVDEVSVPPDLISHLTQIHRYASLVNLLRLTDMEVAFVLEQPALFGIGDITRLTLANVWSLYRFKWLVYRFQDQQNGFISYLRKANQLVSKAHLAAILGIDVKRVDGTDLQVLNVNGLKLTFQLIDSVDQLPVSGKSTIFVGIAGKGSEIYARILDADGNNLTPNDTSPLSFDGKRDSETILRAVESTSISSELDEQTKIDIIQRIFAAALPNVWNVLVQNKILTPEGRILITNQNDLRLPALYQQYAAQVWSLFEERIDPANALKDLARLTRWDSTYIAALASDLWPQAQGENGFPVAPLGRVDGLLRLKQCFDLRDKTGLSITLLARLHQLFSAPNNDAASAYQAFSTAASSLLAAVKAKYSDTDWEQVYQPIQVELNEKKRDALVDAMFVRHRLSGIELHNRRDLYEYLLIDVDVSGLVDTSRLTEVLACLQLYIYRCQLQLETGVTLAPEFEQYWSWIKTYRIWEANRRVYLYPENYIQPDLRKTKTPLSAQLEQSFQQTHLSKENVDQAVKSYLDGFAEVANLRYAGSCATKHLPNDMATTNPDHPNQILYLVGRTKYPYQYYYRTAEFTYDNSSRHYAATRWQPWTKISLTISAKYPSPIFAFNKLFIFWVEIKPGPSDRENANHPQTPNKTTNKRFEVSLYFSFYDFNKNWVAPQPLGEPILLPLDVNSIEKTQDIFWQRIHLSYANEQIYVQYPGFFTALDITLTSTLPAPIVNLSNGNIPFFKFVDVLTPTLPEPGKNPDEDISVDFVKFVKGRTSWQTGIKFIGDNFFSLESLSLGSNYTFAAWVWIDPMSGGSLFSDPESKMKLEVIDTAQGKSIRFMYDNGNFDIQTYPVPTQTWVHIAFTMNEKGHHYYINGQAVSSFNSFVQAINKQLRIGHGFYGVMDGVSLYDIFLNSDQIEVLANTHEGIPAQLLPALFASLPKKTSTYKVTNSPMWYILDTGKSEYLLFNPVEGLSNLLSDWWNSNPLEPDFIKCIRLNSISIHTLSQDLFANGIDALLTLDSQRSQEDSFASLGPTSIVAKPWPTETLDFQGANGLYYWELFFHMPFLVADNLNTAQQFEEAQRWYHYIYNPAARDQRTWRFVKFSESPAETPSHELIDDLQDKLQLEEYYRDPFDPHAIAHLRPSAYQRTVQMHYIDNLINWGDQLFQQDTRETLVEATLLYVMAYDLLGRKPINLGDQRLPPAETLGSLRDKFSTHEIPEFLLDVEKSVSSGVASPSASAHPHIAIANSYFGIPKNEYYLHYWERVEQPLHNIRYNLTLDGKPNHLPLFEPPISPALLVQAVAGGQDISQALAAMAIQPPYYRFLVVLEKAKSVTSTVIQFGGALLSALEKWDGERLSQLHATHETALITMNRLAKEDQVAIAQAGLDGLQRGLAAATARQGYYEDLIQKGLLDLEQNQISFENDAIDMQKAIEGIKIGVAIAYLVPTVYGLADGDLSPGDAANQAVQVIETNANMKSQQSNVMAAQAQFSRRTQEWLFQQTQAEDDIAQINAQIEAAKQQIAIATQDLAIFETTLSQSQEIASFLNSKYTNAELYQWIVSKLSALYFQSYQLALTLALSAQKAWQFEQTHDQSLIQQNAWNSLRKGLLAGEALMLNLHQLEKAYMDQGERRLEIIKTIPLSTVESGKVMSDLSQKGSCIFSLTLDMFNADYNNHYCRQIKSISISVPAVLGPYENIHATLTQTSNTVFTRPNNEGKRKDWRAQQQIALSQGINDSGLFELNFHDDRYLPFEGTGAISDWELEIPQDSNKSLYLSQNSLPEVIIEVRYTAKVG